MSNLVRRVLRYLIAVVLAAVLGGGSIVSVPTVNAQNNMAPQYGKLEAAPGINVKARMWNTFGGTIGGSVPIGLKHEKSRCTYYVNVKAPEGDTFVQKSFSKGSKKSFPCLDQFVTDRSTDVPVELKRKMLNMQIPAICRHGAGRLIDGKLEESAILQPGGWITILTNPRDGELANSVSAKWIDIDKDDTNEIALIVQCYGGGVGWPESIFVLDQNLNFIGVGPNRYGLELPSEYAPDRAKFIKFETRDGTFHLKYLAYAPGDAGCCGTLMAEGDFRVEGQKLVPVSPPKIRKRA